MDLTKQCTARMPLLAAMALFTTQGIQAQNLVEQDLIAPIGTSWHMRAMSIVPEEQLPEDPVIWNYEDVIGNDLFGASFTVVPPNQVSGHGAYPAADRAVRSTPDNAPGEPTHIFHDLQSTQALELGSIGPVLTTLYRLPAQAFVYPMVEGETVMNNFCFNSTDIIGTVDYCGTTEITLTNIGTLILPYRTFTDVQQVTTRRATVRTPGLDSTILITKDWYANGIPYPLLHISKLQNPDGSLTRTGQILDENSLVGLPEFAQRKALEVFPNPTAGAVRLETVGGRAVLEVLSNDGRTIRSTNLITSEGSTALDLSDLPDGVYHLALRDGASVRMTRVVVAH